MKVGKLKSYNYIYIPGQGQRVLCLLHGTGGDEYDLVKIGEEIDPTAHIISPRGNVAEGGLNRFFARPEEGVFDNEEVKERSEELADFIRTATEKHNLKTSPLTAVGYSNGANVATVVALLHPDILQNLILFRPMFILSPKVIPSLKSKEILILSGENDELIPRKSSGKLSEVFTSAGAHVHQVKQSQVFYYLYS